MIIFFYLTIFLFGLAAGSFFNVLIIRLNREQGRGIGGRSHCPKCGHQLAWQDLVPVLSFFWLGGKCRYCGKPISWQYPLVEIATGLLFLFIFNFQFFPTSSRILDGFAIGTISNQFLNSPISNFLNLAYLLFITGCLIVIFVSDLKYFIIPDEIIMAGIVGTLAFRLFEILNFGHWDLLAPLDGFLSNGVKIWDLPARLASESVAGGGFVIFKPLGLSLISALVASAFFLLIVLVTRGKGMGLGDVKMAFLMGLVLGWPQILAALLLAFVSGALVGLGLIAAGRAKMKSEIPFGTFLAAATLLIIFFGSQITVWYSGLFF